MNTEELAVAEAQKQLSWSERLVPGLVTQDKVINTDGPIQIYESERRDKSSHIGNVQAQVKGEAWNKDFPDTITHSATLVDLSGYLKEGGLILIKALVHRKTRTIELYYMALTPFKILDFIKKAGARKSTTLRLAKLPQDPDALVGIVLYTHAAQREDPNNHGKPLNLREGYSLEIVTSRDISFDSPITLDRARGDLDFTVFRTDESGVRAPVDAAFEIIPPDYIEHLLDLKVGSRSVTYETVTGKHLDANTVRANLSDGLYFVGKRSDDRLDVSVTINTEGTVGQFAKDGQFYTECLDEKAIWLNGKRMAFDAAHDVSDMREQHSAVTRYIPLLDRLHVDASLIRTDDLTEHVLRELETTRRGILESEEIEPASLSSGRFSIDIGAQRIEVLLELSEASNKWIFHDPYSPDFARQYYYIEGEDGEEKTVRLVTPYDVLEVDDIKRTLNLNVANAVASYAKLPKASQAAGLSNEFVLKLLLAADQSESRREEFLTGAGVILEWIGAQSDGADPVHKVNTMQLKARRAPLSDADMRDLRKLRREADQNEDSTSREIAFCCSVLLGDVDDARDRKDEMPQEQASAIDKWPICALLR